MSLDVYLEIVEPVSVFEANITHNLTRMADAAGIYYALWRPEDLGFDTAADLIKPLSEGLERMRSDPERFRQFDAENGWGTYDQFVPWIERYLEACIANPTSTVRVSR